VILSIQVKAFLWAGNNRVFLRTISFSIYHFNPIPMKKLNNLLFFLFLLIMMTSCNLKNKSARIASQSDYPAPPMAMVIPDTMLEFGNARIDNYFWMKDRDNPEVMAYLKSENAYTDTVMAHTKDLQEKLFQEMKGRIKEEDQSVPQIDNGYFYYNRTEKDKQYPIYCRKKGNVSSPEEVLFDVNKMAEGSQAYILSNYEITPDNKLAAYSYNTTGSYAEFNLKIRNLENGEDLPYEITNVQSFVWANDNKTLFYTKSSETFRPYRVYRHQINSKVPDELLFEEKDEMFNLYVGKSKTKEYIYIDSGSFTTSEYRYLPADKPLADFKMFLPRQKDIDYSIQHHKTRIFIKYKDPQNINSMIYEAPLSGFSDKSTWKELVKHGRDCIYLPDRRQTRLQWRGSLGARDEVSVQSEWCYLHAQR
jgi:oligopeptidase B